MQLHHLLLVVLLAAAISTAAGSSSSSRSGRGQLQQAFAFLDWSYRRPEQWSSKWGFTKCELGKRQSPVAVTTFGEDARGKIVHRQTYTRLQMRYAMAAAKVVRTNHTAAVDFSVGTTPQMMHVNLGSFVLREVRVHTPAEHSVDGKEWPIELQFIHQQLGKEEKDKDYYGIVSVMVEVGEDNIPLHALFDVMEKEKKEADLEFDPAWLLPGNLDYVAYHGSLTTPPCSENAYHFILTSRIQASRADIDRARKFAANTARPRQPLNGRQFFTEPSTQQILEKVASRMDAQMDQVVRQSGIWERKQRLKHQDGTKDPLEFKEMQELRDIRNK